MAREGMLLVGAEDATDGYRGPVAEITWDDTWVHIVTDSYEGHVMLNIEVLPFLQQALKRVQAALSKGEGQ